MQLTTSALSIAVVAALAAGCKGHGSGHDHADDHPKGHDHHEEGHGHGDGPVVRITRWSERLELFAEHPTAIAGVELKLLTHLTVLEDFRALEQAEVVLELTRVNAGGDANANASPLTASAKAPLRPGIYELVFTPPQAGTYRGRLVVSGSVVDVIDGLEVVVAADAKGVTAAPAAPEEDASIELLKEQQWGLPFATAFARKGALVPAIEVAGTVGTPPGGSADIGAPITGRVIAPPQGLPRPGIEVRKGQLLATLAPAPSSPEEAARASLAVSEADARLARARAAAERAERLIKDQAISQRDVEDARREVGVAEEAARAARGAQQLFVGATGGAGAGSWRLVSPISGTLVEVAATPGATVAPGTLLFRVVDTRELWISARVPEQDAARLRADRDAAYQIAGLDGFLPIAITDKAAGASLVAIGRTVDQVSRTVDVIYALTRPASQLRVGGLVRVSVPAGDEFVGVVVPTTAIVEDEGREVVYVQVDGEHFEARVVKTSARMGDRIGISQGLVDGERVVTRGANVVRLAARAPTTEAHGHIH
ncbi:MAG: efflux RND transporter periplasmic adaptor subunit [Myxococcales bacterium]|nr:efflux RND transporter periplasmic adaptor subunit [Myxococcales bacterium]